MAKKEQNFNGALPNFGGMAITGHLDFLIVDKLLAYQPKNFDLLIFPNYMIHRPTQNKKEEWRISINMEIMAKENVNELFF